MILQVINPGDVANEYGDIRQANLTQNLRFGEIWVNRAQAYEAVSFGWRVVRIGKPEEGRGAWVRREALPSAKLFTRKPRAF